MSSQSSRDPKGAGMNGVLLLLGLSVFVNYIDRANLSVAAPLLRGELSLSSSQLGLVLSAFFWTYACMQPVVGWLVDRFEVKWVFAIGFFLWSAATALTGMIHAFAALLVMRIILGVGESVAYPAYSKIFATHFVEGQRGVANSAIGAGQALGPGLGMLIGGMVIAMLGWRPFFIALGLVSLLWLAPWLRWMPRTPGCGATDMQTGPGLPEIIRHKSSWGTFIGLFCSNYFLYFMLTWLPLYLVEERHFSMHGMARIGGATFLLAAASSLIFGRLTDRWIAAGASVTRVRKGCMILATTCIGLCMAGAALAPPVVAVGLLLLAGTSFGLISSNLTAITQTLAGPSAAGRWMGMQNFVGNMAGWVVPALTGLLVQRTGHYYWPFFITAAMAWIGTLNWIVLVGAVEPMMWKTGARSIVAGVSQMVGEPSVPASHL